MRKYYADLDWGSTALLTKKLACFVLSLKIINTFMHLIVNRSRNSNMALKFNQAKQFLSYWSKQYFDCFDPYLKNRLAY